MSDAALFQLESDEVVIVEFLCAYVLAQQANDQLTILEQLAVSAFLGLLGQVLVVVASQRALIDARQQMSLEEQVKALKKEIAEIKKALEKK
ncbi:MAG: hypothetical protein H6Q74_2622 [Firmicutes bacterium]|nr:hypothetical protein [Bacillota bacterium]